MPQVDSDDPNDADGERRPPGFGGTIFLQQAAHVAVIDGRGRIITVNDAWTRFGRDNGLSPAYAFVGVSYLDICERAVGADRGGEGAGDALGGINKILAAEQSRFSLIYPCHAPDKQRWFLMYARPIAAHTDGAVISHVDVTSLHLAGLVPDETRRSARSSPTPAEKLARFLFPGDVPPPTSTDARLR
jgi:hypothetical protein